jgi:hypothetical protein
MKKIILFLLLTTSLISCTQNEGSKTPADMQVLILGKWNLVSDTFGTANNPVENITTCQKEFWQFDFKNNNEIVFRSTSDDPSLTSSQCDPKLLNYTYSISNGTLIMTPVNGGYSAFTGIIKSLSNTQLVLRGGIDTNNKFRTFTFKKQ